MTTKPRGERATAEVVIDDVVMTREQYDRLTRAGAQLATAAHDLLQRYSTLAYANLEEAAQHYDTVAAEVKL